MPCKPVRWASCPGSRREFCRCLPVRADALFGLADAVLCAGGPVRSLAGLSLAAGHRRGHGALYDAVSHGRIAASRLRRVLAGLPLPRAADGRLVLAADVSCWLRPGAATSPDRLFCHVYGRARGQAQMIPGWPYSVVAALEPGRTSWTAVLDAVRLGPDDDQAAVTAAQVRDVVTRLIAAGHWRAGDPAILVIFDAGYDVPRLACQLSACPSSCSAGCAPTACCSCRRPRARPAAMAGPASTAASWHSPTRRPGRPRRWSPARRPPATGPPQPRPGTGCTPG
jgi:DDE superfamily endonuclease